MSAGSCSLGPRRQPWANSTGAPRSLSTGHSHLAYDMVRLVKIGVVFPQTEIGLMSGAVWPTVSARGRATTTCLRTTTVGATRPSIVAEAVPTTFGHSSTSRSCCLVSSSHQCRDLVTGILILPQRQTVSGGSPNRQPNSICSAARPAVWGCGSLNPVRRVRRAQGRTLQSGGRAPVRAVRPPASALDPAICYLGSCSQQQFSVLKTPSVTPIYGLAAPDKPDVTDPATPDFSPQGGAARPRPTQLKSVFLCSPSRPLLPSVHAGDDDPDQTRSLHAHDVGTSTAGVRSGPARRRVP